MEALKTSLKSADLLPSIRIRHSNPLKSKKSTLNSLIFSEQIGPLGGKHKGMLRKFLRTSRKVLTPVFELPKDETVPTTPVKGYSHQISQHSIEPNKVVIEITPFSARVQTGNRDNDLNQTEKRLPKDAISVKARRKSKGLSAIRRRIICSARCSV